MNLEKPFKLRETDNRVLDAPLVVLDTVLELTCLVGASLTATFASISICEWVVSRGTSQNSRRDLLEVRYQPSPYEPHFT